jgi:hypothetical protein
MHRDVVRKEKERQIRAAGRRAGRTEEIQEKRAADAAQGTSRTLGGRGGRQVAFVPEQRNAGVRTARGEEYGRPGGRRTDGQGGGGRMAGSIHAGGTEGRQDGRTVRGVAESGRPGAFMPGKLKGGRADGREHSCRGDGGESRRTVWGEGNRTTRSGRGALACGNMKSGTEG